MITLEDLIREVVSSYSYHLSDECVEALADRLREVLFS